jgi:hypothetical protein
MSKAQHYILLVSLIIWVVSYNLWIFFDSSVYYIGTAVFILGLSLLIDMSVKEKWKQITSKFFLILAVNNVLDEVFFNPTTFDFNEYITIFLFLIYTAWRIWKN